MLVKPSRYRLNQRLREAYAASHSEDCVHTRTLGSVLDTVNRELQQSAFMSTFFYGAAAPSGPGPLHSRGLTITHHTL